MRMCAFPLMASAPSMLLLTHITTVVSDMFVAKLLSHHLCANVSIMPCSAVYVHRFAPYFPPDDKESSTILATATSNSDNADADTAERDPGKPYMVLDGTALANLEVLKNR